MRPSLSVELVKVSVLKSLRQLHYSVCSEVEDDHCISILHHPTGRPSVIPDSMASNDGI